MSISQNFPLNPLSPKNYKIPVVERSMRILYLNIIYIHEDVVTKER